MNTVIITPSYAPDFERCRALVESVKKHVYGYTRHVIVVDLSDVQLFSRLTGDRCELVVKEEILPSWLKPLPCSRKWWFSLRTLPVRGWILQQIVKLSAAEWCDEECYMFIDSDVLFVRPYDVRQILSPQGLRLYAGIRKEADYADHRHENWYKSAASLFGLQGRSHTHRDYISQMNTWRRDTLIEMYRTIEQNTGKEWKKVLCNTLDFSEYVLYGIFVECVRGVIDAGHYVDKEEICHCSWHYDVHNQETLNAFIKSIGVGQSAILVQSNLQIDSTSYTPAPGFR